MTKQQEAALKKIRRLVENYHSPSVRDKYEVKQYDVNENEYSIDVYIVIGMKNDEGTMAEIICRDHAHLFIGPRGGITYPVSKNGHHYKKRFRGYDYSLLETVIDQR